MRTPFSILGIEPALALAMVLVGGCQQKGPRPLDHSQIVVTPGLGISNRYEVGMTFPDIRKTFTDAIVRQSVRGKHSKSMAVSSLGAMSYIGDDLPISHIEFYLQPYQSDLYPDLEIRTPFRGRLGNDLDFGGKSITSQDVVAVYGPIQKRVSEAGDGLKFMLQPEPFSRSNRVSEETWWYPARGVSFDIESNRVTSFQVFRPTATNTSNEIPRTK